MYSNKALQIGETKSSVVYRLLKKNICEGRLRPGQKLLASELSMLYGVSIIPIREALIRLEVEDLITQIPHTGLYVSEIETDYINQIYPIRGALEALAARLAIPFFRDESFAHLKQLLNKMYELIKHQRYSEMGEVNYEFHMTIYGESLNEYLLKMIRELWEKTNRVRAVFNYVPERAEASNLEHEQIIEALRNKRASEVETLIIQQNEKSLRLLNRYLESKRNPETLQQTK